ncbi:MAG: FHA domain-containing protein [Lactimicrobium sp.]|jgi:hypothetical protein|uniref:FHA domain-containing protein n=1 Tax=Lactimicrobium sp. TaxID=2563780 RepID=UPI002F35CFA4
MSAILSDPTLVKALLVVLIGMIVVLSVAVVVLAVKKNQIVYVEKETPASPSLSSSSSSSRTVRPVHAAAAAPTATAAQPLVLNKAQPKDDLDLMQFKNPHADEDEAMETNVVPSMHNQPSSRIPQQQDEDQPVSQAITGVSLTIMIGQAKTEVSVRNFPCLLGREADVCDVIISEPAVSRRHAKLLLEHGEVFVEDVSEHNGTFLNDMKLPPLGRARLHTGDLITLGRAHIRVNAWLYNE